MFHYNEHDFVEIPIDAYELEDIKNLLNSVLKNTKAPPVEGGKTDEFEDKIFVLKGN